MKLRRYTIILFLISFFFLTSSFYYFSSIEKISSRMESKTLIKGKLLTVVADLYYRAYDGKLITHYISPRDYYVITNSKGELKIYDEKKNEVYLSQNIAYSTETTVFYYFLSEKSSDLGLREMGFTLTKTEVKNKMTITKWFPPKTMYNQFSSIELVHENNVPIYISYINPKKKLIKKVYYSNYFNYGFINLPQRITQFDYLSTGDSLINRMTFTDIKIDNQSNSKYFNYSIPATAKIVK